MFAYLERHRNDQRHESDKEGKPKSEPYVEA
jgi:hypothetical protein